MLSWAKRRQILYLSTIFLVIVAVLTAVFFLYQPQPTCFDGKQNQDEQDVDCGGSCKLACRNLTDPVRILWARPFPVMAGKSDFAALAYNPNQKEGVENLGYTIRLYDGNNAIIAEKKGSTFINPNEQFVLFESGLSTGQRPAKRAAIFFDRNSVWQRVDAKSPVLSVVGKDILGTTSPRLKVTVANDSFYEVTNIFLSAVLSDESQNALAVSSSFLDRLGPKSSQDVYFTWPKPFERAPVLIDVYYRVNTFDL